MSAVIMKLRQYLTDSYQELKRVVWPTRTQMIHHTVIVIVFSIAVALFLGALDLAFNYGVQRILLK